MSDYPDDEELKILREWDGSPAALVDYLQCDHWWMPSFGLHVEQIAVEDESYYGLYLSTGGWSGNEERIDALQRPGRFFGFWGRFWYSSRRGGHFEFRIPVEQWDEPIQSFAVTP